MFLKRIMISLAAAIAAFAMSVAPALAASDPIYTGRFNNLAVGGYDTITYFQDAGPQKGSADFSTEYQGAKWQFVSQENLDLFVSNPTAYAPQYGGYCAWAIADNKLAKGNPKYWNVIDGKLYLNFNRSIQKKWEADIPGFIATANDIWPGILSN